MPALGTFLAALEACQGLTGTPVERSRVQASAESSYALESIFSFAFWVEKVVGAVEVDLGACAVFWSFFTPNSIFDNYFCEL
ncbi:uncharacterized protein K460DRAFT_371341 [Cucurbitaria berberidis CBS 394.84]|uniref:Uncharacterized protein n=1 Tax=Cucurbitaria berberidis CBS 394.84 TaxID=1168544 RepID=A0A9P4L3C0_9PLEO|nr:uncharacterized protein K460DRAFT_371341 [Cucurbitaria berberidis CBS 394.84]KAF1840124.1 hypothetical protein K460DRAFT_371341 [Cucurbitaria berberidis CBS 394.84]